MIRFDTRQFENSHGRKPRGYGLWWFEFGTRTLQYTGTLTQAKDAIIAVLREDGVKHATVTICP